MDFSLHLYAFLSTIQYGDVKRIEDHFEEILLAASEVFRGEKGLEELMKFVLYVINRTDVSVEKIKSPVPGISRTNPAGRKA